MREPVTKGAVRHVVPVVADGEPEHDTTGFCWCQPLHEGFLGGGHLYIHRRTLDSPHIDTDGDYEGEWEL